MASSTEEKSQEKGAIEKVKRVQVDSLVALKVIKHCQEEGLGTELVKGFLVGLVVGDTLEVTNSFPLPKAISIPLGEYQRDMLSNMRKVNSDYHQVGWYQSTYLGLHFTQVFLESHYHYQLEISESVVLIYDPLKTTLGNLSLRGFRLSEKILQMLQKNDVFTPESLQEVALKHGELFEELPVTIRQSNLVNGLLHSMSPPDVPPYELLHLSATQHLENHMFLLMESLDTLQQETYKLLGYERNCARQQQLRQQFIQKRKEENIRREKEGERLLPMDDGSIDKELNARPIHAPHRQTALLTAEQVDNQCDEILDVSGQAFSKLYLSQSLYQ